MSMNIVRVVQMPIDNAIGEEGASLVDINQGILSILCISQIGRQGKGEK